MKVVPGLSCGLLALNNCHDDPSIALPCCFARMLHFLGVEDLRFIAWMSFFMLCQAAGFSAVLVQYLRIDPKQPAYAVAKGSAQSIQACFDHILIVIL